MTVIYILNQLTLNSDSGRSESIPLMFPPYIIANLAIIAQPLDVSGHLINGSFITEFNSEFLLLINVSKFIQLYHLR